ncbi:MAG: low-specificity L-threonine aldolase [Dehalococcoidia bacterium]
MRTVDFRSDTVTHPTPEMYRAMMEAELGDDEYGDDPTLNRLEALAAEMLGKETAVFTPSGTMSNLVAVLAHCRRGDEMIVGHRSHMFTDESGGASTLGGVHVQTIHNDDRGMLDPQEVEEAIRPDNPHFPTTGLIALENTHTSFGGVVLTQDDIGSVARVARKHDIPLHIDGARIFNASVYLETPVSELVKDADSVSFCLSKGLSCPIGSLLCGSEEFIKKARFWRETVGGGMRQVGVIAAAGIVALESMIDRLAEDHANARRLALGLSRIPGISIDPERYPTNQVYFQVTAGPPAELARRLEERGIKGAWPWTSTWRFVTHYGIGPEDIDHALDVVEAVFREFFKA